MTLQLRKRTGLRVCVTDTKMAVMRCIGLTPQQVDDTFTTDPAETPIHVVRTIGRGEVTVGSSTGSHGGGL